MATSDLGHQLTDKELAKLERRIAKLYREAGEELQATIDAYFEQFKKRDEEMKALIGTVQNGKEWTEADYKQWRLNQIGRGERYQAMRDKVARRTTDANAVAVSYANDATPGIYSLNRNYAAYTIEQVAGNVGFDLWDEQTVKRLMVEQPDLMPYYPPKRALKRGIDLAYGKKQITASVTSSILQGKSIKHMADDLQKRITTMSRDSAIRTARTAVTGAQNAGRMDSYAAAEKMGIKLKKEWLATLDARTRHSHAMLDGEQVAQDKKFSNGCRFPGDPQGPPWEIYNCRCTLVAALDGVDTSSAQRRARNAVTGETELISNMSYAEWAGWKKQTTLFQFSPANSIEEAKRFALQTLNLENIDYSRFDLSVANMVNQEINRFYNIFGDLHEKGVLRAVMNYPKKSSFYAAYQPGYGVVYMKNVNSKNSLAKMLKDAKIQYKSGFWSTGTAEHAVRHELGHAIQHLYTDKDAVMRNKISVLRKNVASACGITNWSMSESKDVMLKAGEMLSYYGLRNDGEFIAECVAEYIGGAPRETARKVVNILLGRD